jgi:hypothetical protein
MNQPPHVRQCGGVADGPPAARVGAGADVPSGPAPPEQLLDKGLTDTKEGGNGPLGAEPFITGAENLFSQVNGIGFHPDEPNRRLPYVQSRIAIG